MRGVVYAAGGGGLFVKITKVRQEDSFKALKYEKEAKNGCILHTTCYNRIILSVVLKGPWKDTVCESGHGRFMAFIKAICVIQGQSVYYGMPRYPAMWHDDHGGTEAAGS